MGDKNALPVKSCYKAHYALRKTGDTFDKPVYLENLTEYGVEKEVSQDPYYAEGTLKYNSNTLKEIPLTLAIGDLLAANECALLGHEIGTSGEIIRTDSDKAPDVAICISDKKADDSIVATWYYSGQFAPGGRSGATSEGTANYQNKTITAMFKPTDFTAIKGVTDVEYNFRNEAEFESWIATVAIPTKKSSQV